jgi:hypothetical protein
MAADAFGRDLLRLEPREYVTLEGFPSSGETSRWHVNKAVTIGSSAEGTNHAIILQRADASDEWLAITIEDKPDGLEFTTFNHIQDAMPPAGGEEPGDRIDPAGISLKSIES